MEPSLRSLESMEGLPPAESPHASVATGFEGYRDRVRAIYPGLLVALTIALASDWLAQHYGAPVMLFALLFGMAFHFLHEEGRCITGIEFAARGVLRTGVALLGARITAAQIAGLGPAPVAMVIAAVITTILIGIVLARLLGLSRNFCLLSGGAVGICGASAALAIASVLPRETNSERDTILAVVTVTALSTVAMILYPLLIAPLHLDHIRAGLFLGGTIHDVAQVVGAGYLISPETGDTATYIKLLRVAMLLPVVFTIGALFLQSREDRSQPRFPRLPLFLIAFAALVVANSLHLFGQVEVEGMSVISRWCLITAIAALGMKTSFKDVASVGWRPVGLMLAETVWIGGLVLASIQWQN